MLAEGCSSRCLLARECSDKSMDKRRYDRRLTKEACRLCREAVCERCADADLGFCPECYEAVAWTT